jgi:2'-5' RNA ligase
VRPPAVAVAHLDAAIVRDAPMRWVPPDRWHITLEFVGDGDPAATIERWTERTSGRPPLDLRLDGAGAFPRAAHGRFLWIGIAGDADPLRALAADDQQLHLTVARNRVPLDLRAAVAANAAYRGPSWTVGELVLFDSRLGTATDGGPAYDEVAHFPLVG